MKKCPVCDKEFPDSMRFCQTDGTPLVENSLPDDPYKTTVGRQEDIAAAIPPSDPFKTVVGSGKKDESGDLLQIPEEFDPLKTMFVSESEIRKEMSGGKDADNSVIEVPPIAPEKSEPTPFPPPTPPIFNEPNITPPNFGDAPSPTEQKTPIVSNPFNEPEKTAEPIANPFDQSAQKTEVISNPFASESKPSSPFDDKPNNAFDSSPFGRSGNTGPIPSPFDASMPPGYQPPTSPLPPYQEPEKPISTPAYEEPKLPSPPPVGSNPFDNPPVSNAPISSQSDNQNWNPPPVDNANLQNQSIGQNAPSQPAAASQGQSQTMAVASLICGIIGLISVVGLIIPILNIICGIVSFGLALAAIITGLLARGRANKNPAQYGGAKLALGGIITGFLTILAMVGLTILTVILVGAANFSR